jgi:hypothetical protein
LIQGLLKRLPSFFVKEEDPAVRKSPDGGGDAGVQQKRADAFVAIARRLMQQLFHRRAGSDMDALDFWPDSGSTWWSFLIPWCRGHFCDRYAKN